jgi:hypothetical protein
MITVKNTPNMAGVEIRGDFYDFEKLVDAFYTITANEFEDKHKGYIHISTRVLGLCYDLRHAMQGDRGVELVENGMDEEKMRFHSVIAPRNNVYYQCKYLYPEMFFVMLALNELVKLRMRELVKSKYEYNIAFNKDVIWDDKIATIRSFQAEFAKCVREALTENSFSRWIKVMNNDYIFIKEIAGQYVDLLNIKYLKMNKEKRLKNLTVIAKRIADFQADPDYREIKEVVAEAVKEHGCSESDIRLEGIEYPEEILW